MKRIALLLAAVLLLTLAGCARVSGSKTPTTAAPTAPAGSGELEKYLKGPYEHRLKD